MIDETQISGRRRTSMALLALCALTLSLATEDTRGDPRTLLGPGDDVRVVVYQHPDLTVETRVSDSGTIVVPLVGEISLDGLTPIDAGRAIAQALRNERILVDPQVTVMLLAVRSRQVSVLGHVMRPGQYALDGTVPRLTDMLAMAGGISDTGGDAVILITTRNGETEKQEINIPQMYRSADMSGNVEMHSGDTIFVPTAPVFYVYGQVQRAGPYRLRPNTSVLEALSTGGGLTPRGTHNGLQIHRHMSDGTIAILKAELTDVVAANDVIHVKESLF